MNTDDILARLMNGESSETIAKEMTDALNKALAKKSEAEAKAKAEKEAREREETARVERENKLNEAAQKVADTLHEYFCLLAPEFKDSDMTLTKEEVHNITEEVLKTLKVVKVVKPKAKKVKDDFDTVIENFFKDMGI